MKKQLTAAALLLALALCRTAARAGGGDAGDPLISRSYLEGAFSQSIAAAADSRADESGRTLRAAVRRRLEAMKEGFLASGQRTAAMNPGGTLSGSTGLSVTPLAGELTLTRGTAVDVTAGREIAAGEKLAVNHRCVVAEGSSAVFTAGSPVAAAYEGDGQARDAAGFPDCWGAARALRSLGLFRGTGSGVGEGLDLHLTLSRGEGLALFIRVLGEEDEAMAYTGTHPFTDVPSWLDRYAAWAYGRGYANGVAPTLFGSGRPISAAEFEELLLRALGYSTAGVDNYATSLERALECGALTAGEYELLREGPLLRAHAAYLSYYALETLAGGSGQTLAQRLEAGGAFTAGELADARAGVSAPRIR